MDQRTIKRLVSDRVMIGMPGMISITEENTPLTRAGTVLVHPRTGFLLPGYIIHGNTVNG
jgi:hypothetical protein